MIEISQCKSSVFRMLIRVLSFCEIISDLPNLILVLNIKDTNNYDGIKIKTNRK